MSMKFHARELQSKPGHYAVFNGKRSVKYQPDTLTTDKHAAEVDAAYQNAHHFYALFLEAHATLEELGEIDDRDPRGYLV